MEIHLRNQAQVWTGLKVIRLLSVFTVALGGTVSFGSEQEESAERPLQNSSGISLAPRLNELMIGCSQDGAINYLLKRGGYRLELVDAGLGGPGNESPKEYDEAYILRVGSTSQDTWSPYKICLYFRGGYLAYKCIVSDETVDPHEVFRREIASGLQHPPNYPGLMDRVRWGRAAEPHIDRPSAGASENEKEAISSSRSKQAAWPRVRCGIVFEDLPPSATEQRYNVLVIYQNVGPVALDDDMLLRGFPADPGIIVTAKYIDREERNGFPGNFGISGSKLYHRNGGQGAAAMRRAAFRLEPGEATYMWLHVPDVQSAISLQARVTGLWGADKEDERLLRRRWDAASPRVATSRPVRMCGSPGHGE